MRRYLILILGACFLGGNAVSARPSEMVADSVELLQIRTEADSLAAGDSLTDEEIMKMLAKQDQQVEAPKVKDKGIDVSRLVNAKRMRPDDDTDFESRPFMKNTFASLGMTMHLLDLDNHSIGYLGSVAFGKWFHEDHAVRAQISVGKWEDNYDFSQVIGTQLDFTYLFNISSFVNGFRPSRFCDINIVAGLGYSNSSMSGNSNLLTAGGFGHAFSFHLGTRLDFRIFKNIDMFIEPQAVGFTDGVTAYEGSWRGVKPGFRGTVGLTYNIMQSYGADSPKLLSRKKGYFVDLMAGPHFQNSSLVYEVGLKNCVGVHVGLGVGKHYTDYFAMRYSFAFSRNPWIAYLGETLPCSYFAVRAEGMLDVLSFVRFIMYKGENTRHKFLSASLVFGPEIGYMNKEDLRETLGRLYLGVSTGAQVKFRLTPLLALFVEPRFSIVPYAAPAVTGSGINSYQNYYDGVMNFNAGIELCL